MNQIILQIQGGTVSLPAKLRARYQLEEGAALTLLDLGGAFILSPKPALVPQLAAELERKRKAAGLSPADLQEGLDEQRRAYAQAQYDIKPSDTQSPRRRRRPRRGRILHDRR